MNRRDFLKLSPLALLGCAYTPQPQTGEPYIYLEATTGDETARLQAAFDLLNDRYAYTGQANSLVILKGTFRLLSGPVYIRNKYRVRVLGLDCNLAYNTIDAQGSTYLTLERVHMTNPNALAFKYGRGVDQRGGGLFMKDCQIDGHASIAQADNSVFDNVNIKGDTLLTSHHDGICPVSSYIGNQWRNCWLKNVSMQGLVQSVSFDNCYFTGKITTEDNPAAGTGNQCHNIELNNCRVENVPQFIEIKNQRGTHGLNIRNLNISYHAQTVIKVNNAYTNYGWDIGYINKGNPSAVNIELVNGVLYKPRIYGS